MGLRIPAFRCSWTRALVAGSVAAALAFVASSTGAFAATKSASGAASSSAAAPKFDKRLFKMLPARIQKSRKISFGALWETPPVIAVDPKSPSKPVGLAVDLAAAVSKVIGVTPEWKNLQWPAQLPGLQSGNVDVLWGQVSDSKEREQSVADLISWMQQPWALLLAGGNPKGVTTLANACGLKIAVPTGSQQTDIVNGNSEKFCTSKGKPAIEPVGYPGAQGAIVALKAGSVDGWMDDSAAIKAIVKSSPSDFTDVVLPNSQITPYASNISAVAVGKAQPGVTRAIAAALKRLAAPGGVYQRLMKKWGTSEGVMPAKLIRINTYTGISPGKTASG